MRFSLVLMFLLIISLASAGLGTFKQDSCVEIRTILNTTAVNISSIGNEKSGVITYVDAPMTKNGNTFNYTFCNTSNLGNYVYDYYDTEGYVYVNDFNITPSGDSKPLGFYIIVLFLSIGVIVLGFAVRDATITILGSFGLYFLGLYILFYGIDIMKDGTYTWALGIIVLMCAAYISWKAAYEGFLE